MSWICRMVATRKHEAPYTPRSGWRKEAAMIQGLDNVGLAVSDLDDMLDFYSTTLGFAAERGENDAWLTLGNLTIYLFVTHPRDAMRSVRTSDLYADPPGLDHLALRVASIEQAS